MKHILELNEEGIKSLESIFELIASGNIILLLGAGASITNKKYLSSQIIDYYEDKIGISHDISDITELLDVLETTDYFDRKEFDGFVYELLSRLAVTETQRSIVRLPWQQIITTNYDLLIEKAYEEIRGSETIFEIKSIRSINEYNSFTLRNELRYIKLNGCMSDKSLHPFVFSSNDFRKSKKYHETVLKNLKSASYKTNFLSIGYSFADKFGEKLLNTLDEKDYREKRWLFKVDPNANEKLASFYASKMICIIKMSSDEFFERYKLWEDALYEKKYPGLVLKSSDSHQISISPKIAYNFKNSIVQLNDSFYGSFISKHEFYNGEEPNYNVILKGYDIKKTKTLDKVKSKIFKTVDENSSTLIPIFFLVGTFGAGKSTFAYRLIQTIQQSKEFKAVTLEIVEIDTNIIKSLPSLIESITEDYLILLVDNVENNSVFKSLMALRTAISSRQINHMKVLFVVPIRENMLKVNTLDLDYKNIYELPVDTKLDPNEISDFVANLKECSIIDYRDNLEKNAIIYKIQNAYEGDSFVSLIELASNGKHFLALRDAYRQLSQECRDAFIYTALLHRLKLLMPASLLRKLVSKPWDAFIKDVIKAEGKGILIQEEKPMENGAQDLFFRTKHPIIADKLIAEIVKGNEKKYNCYTFILSKLLTGPHYVTMTNDLLKAISRSKEFDNEKINKLFDISYITLQEEPYFLLNYATNLQHRDDNKEIQRAIDLIQYAEGLLEFKSDRFIHRRGALYFALAKKMYKEETEELNLTLKYLEEAKELFEEKQLMDPFSSYSYVDFLELLLWELENVQLDTDEELALKIKIEENIDQSINCIMEGTNRILDIKERYLKHFKYISKKENYISELDEMYDDPILRPLACILKYNFFLENGNPDCCKDLIDEMNQYLHNYEVGLFLFKYYAKYLNYNDSRIKFLNVVRNVNLIKEKRPLHYNYNMFIAELYGNNYYTAFNYLKDLERQHYYINPDFHQIWKQQEREEPRIFTGKIIDYKGKFLAFRSVDLQRVIFIGKGNKISVKIGDDVKCIFHLALNGIRAEILNKDVQE
jgi:hypothetical protein